jgi:hypothetical protein
MRGNMGELINPEKQPQVPQPACELECGIACGGEWAERRFIRRLHHRLFGATLFGGEAYRWNEALPGPYDPSSRLSTSAIGAHLVAVSIPFCWVRFN